MAGVIRDWKLIWGDSFSSSKSLVSNMSGKFLVDASCKAHSDRKRKFSFTENVLNSFTLAGFKIAGSLNKPNLDFGVDRSNKTIVPGCHIHQTFSGYPDSWTVTCGKG